MKKLLKIVVTALGISTVAYLVSREKVLLKKTAHDCDKIKLKQVNMKKFDIVVILVCALVVGGIAATKVYKQKIGSTKPYTFEVCTPTYCYDQIFYDVKKYEKMTDPMGRKFIRIHFNDGSVADFATENKAIKVKK